MNRRDFMKVTSSGAVVLTAAGMSIFETGCSSGIVGEIQTYLGIGIAAFQEVVTILSGAGIIPPGTGAVITMAVNLVKAGWADLQAAIQEYNDAPAASKSTLLGKIKTIIGDVIDNIQKFWSDLNIPNSNILNLVKGLLGIILSTLAGFAGAIPGAALKLSTKFTNAIQYTPQKRSSKQFKSDFNAVCVQYGYSSNI